MSIWGGGFFFSFSAQSSSLLWPDMGVEFLNWSFFSLFWGGGVVKNDRKYGFRGVLHQSAQKKGGGAYVICMQSKMKVVYWVGSKTGGLPHLQCLDNLELI